MTTTYEDVTALASAPIRPVDPDGAPVEFLIADVARPTTDGGADPAAHCSHDKCGCDGGHVR
jgi:hypothetical protein